MESLLSLSFENISSRDPTKIRKGLRQIEGLLAQICLSDATQRKSDSGRKKEHGGTSTRKLRDINSDPAFREFWRLQQSFEWNVPTRLIPTLTHLLSLPSSSPTTTTNTSSSPLIKPIPHTISSTQLSPLLLTTLSLLHALLLLHTPSRSLFSTPTAMTLLLDLLDPSAESNTPGIQTAALAALVAALLGEPRNARCFERVGGLETVVSLSRHRRQGWSGMGDGKRKGEGDRVGEEDGEREVRVRAVEFLYFYLLPETPPVDRGADERGELFDCGGGGGAEVTSSAVGVGVHPIRGAGGISERDGRRERGEGETRSVGEKRKLLGRYLSNVDDLLRDLRDGGAPFGLMVPGLAVSGTPDGIAALCGAKDVRGATAVKGAAVARRGTAGGAVAVSTLGA